MLNQKIVLDEKQTKINQVENKKHRNSNQTKTKQHGPLLYSYINGSPYKWYQYKYRWYRHQYRFGINIDISDIGIDISDIGIDIGDIGFDINGTGIDISDIGIDITGIGIDIIGIGIDINGIGIDITGIGIGLQARGSFEAKSATQVRNEAKLVRVLRGRGVENQNNRFLAEYSSLTCSSLLGLCRSLVSPPMVAF